MASHQLFRAAGMGLMVFLTGLALYPHPPDSVASLLDVLWQPSVQGLIAALGSLGFGSVVKRRG